MENDESIENLLNLFSTSKVPWYKATLAITGCFRGTSRDKLYQELGLESLSDRRWAGRLSFFYKILNGLAARYLYNLVPALNTMLQNS